MDVESVVGPAPRQLRLGSQGPQAGYELVDDLVALHGAEPSPEAVMTVDGISVQPLASVDRSRLGEVEIGPVYRQAPGDGLAVPSGRLFVRFARGDSAAAHQDELAAAGFELESIPSYAPHAAWLRPVGGKVAEALNGLDLVERIPAVQHAEPQLLTAAARRT